MYYKNKSSPHLFSMPFFTPGAVTYNIQWLDTLPFSYFDCYLIWFGEFLMVQKVGEINLFFTTFVNKTTMDSFGLFHQLFQPLKIHQTILNSNQIIHKTLNLMKMDKLGSKNNNFRSFIWRSGSGVSTTISVVFATFPNLADIYTIIRPSN